MKGFNRFFSLFILFTILAVYNCGTAPDVIERSNPGPIEAVEPLDPAPTPNPTPPPYIPPADTSQVAPDTAKLPTIKQETWGQLKKRYR